MVNLLTKYESKTKPAYWDKLSADYDKFFDRLFGAGKVKLKKTILKPSAVAGDAEDDMMGDEVKVRRKEIFKKNCEMENFDNGDHCEEEERNIGDYVAKEDGGNSSHSSHSLSNASHVSHSSEDSSDDSAETGGFSADKVKKKKYKISQENKKHSFFKSYAPKSVAVSPDNTVNPEDFSDETMLAESLKFFKPVVKVPYNYGLSYSYVLNKLNPEKVKDKVYLNYPGGFVPELISKCFTREIDNDFEGNAAELLLNIIDFNSLYPSVMHLYNICVTTINFDTKLPVRVGDKLYNQYDPANFFIYTVKIKINTATLPIILFVARDHLIKSIISGYIVKNTAERKIYKKRMKSFDPSTPDYMQANNFQLALKLRDNSRYGFFNSLFSPLYQPLIASSVTYFGRLKLCTLHFFICYYFWKKRVALEKRGPVYGDTDSLFMVCSVSEINDIVEKFKNLPSSRNIMAVDIEKSIPYMLFLTKKNYIALHEKKIYMKGVLKKSQTFPSKTFLSKFIEIIFTRVFESGDYADALRQILSKFFLESSDDEFSNKRILSKSLASYKNKNVMWLLQLDHLARFKNNTIFQGTKISFTYYNRIFDYKLKYQCELLEAEIKKLQNNVAKMLAELGSKPAAGTLIGTEIFKTNKKIASLEKKLESEKSFVEQICGPLDYRNEDQIDFINKYRPTHSLLIDELKPDYADLEVDKFRMFLCDLEAIICHIFDSMGNKDFENKFKEVFESVVGHEFDLFKTRAAARKGVKRKREPSASGVSGTSGTSGATGSSAKGGKNGTKNRKVSEQQTIDHFFKKSVARVFEKSKLC